MNKTLAGNRGAYDDKSVVFVEQLSKELDVPLYYSIPRLTRKMGMGSVSTSRLIGAIERKGFVVSRTHLSKYAIKTDADIKSIKSCISAVSKDY